MAGYTAPKPPGKRARTNKDERPARVVEHRPSPQPHLPPRPGGVEWPEETVRWWAMLKASPLSDGFVESDWSELQIAALLHAEVWEGSSKSAAELRLRVARFGLTPEDRARLRITFAQADEADAKRPVAPPARYDGLRALGGD